MQDDQKLHWFMFVMRTETTIVNRIHGFTTQNLTRKCIDDVLDSSGMNEPTMTGISYLGYMTKKEFGA